MQLDALKIQQYDDSSGDEDDALGLPTKLVEIDGAKNGYVGDDESALESVDKSNVKDEEKSYATRSRTPRPKRACS